MNYERLMNAGIRFISFRPRSEKEIRDYLDGKLQKSHTSAPLLIEKVISRLRDLGYVDDEKFAQWWISQRTGRKPKGARWISQELKQKGIEIEVNIDEQAHAKIAIEKKIIVWQKLPIIMQKKKLVEYLMRNGFSTAVSYRVVDETLKNQ